ncbi:hypothetical protein H1Q63_06905 [Desmonostoc muscorum CCALA 125]|uniref:Uncharacterized protein n=1 Tax=Desmonostoc muscorum LEGE 12446 TaxID=1828758 RepID=A0A8J7AA25_DESMC|nr:hypothetical protein [Desmonostoc muscorum]MBX9253681.1 hypothetical protein [Desmonostoc muscorum CCALA 125]MCF2145778.1 hypothetical protein [Desmonostoc muscorum LEGE 12446]
MKLFKTALVALVLLVNLIIAQPSWADRPNLTTSPDYIEVTQGINNLLQLQKTPDQSEYTPEEIQQELGEFKLQKYILETAQNWAQCRNETGKTLAIYAHKPKKASQGNTLYFLGNGQITENEWDCDGVYLPIGSKVSSIADAQELTEPLAIKFVDGTQLVAKTNPETGTVEFNVNPAKVFKAGEPNWSIPNLSQADIDAAIPNAPIED